MSSLYDRSQLIVILLTFQLALPILSTDIYLPSLKEIGCFFHSYSNQVQMTLTGYFFTFGIIQLIYGPLSDRFGRRPLMILSLVIYVVATLFCAFSTTIGMLMIGRCLQACGAGSAILTFAIIRDLYQGAQVARMIAYMSAVVALSPIIAPVFGGYIQLLLSWQWNFFLIALIGLILLILSYWLLPETNKYREHKNSLFKKSLLNYQHLLIDRHYMGYALSAAFAFGALFAYVSGVPYVLLNLMGYSPHVFGWLFASAAIGYVLGAFVNGKLLSSVGLDYMCYVGIIGLVSGGIMMLIGYYYYTNNATAIILPQILCEFGISIVVSTTVTKALQPIPQYAGAASALIGFFRFILATLSSYLVIGFHSNTALPLILTILGFGLCSLGCLQLTADRKNLVIILGE